MDEYDDYDDYEAAVDAVDEKVTGDVDADVAVDDVKKRNVARKKMIDDIERERFLDY